VVLVAFILFTLQVWAELLKRLMFLRYPDVESNARKET
jgi:TRAP-type mannitol/chloroaromatic compound transport system permease small subunit